MPNYLDELAAIADNTASVGAYALHSDLAAFRARVEELEGEVRALREALEGGVVAFTGKADGLDRRGFDIISAADGHSRIPLGKYVLVEFERARAALKEAETDE